MLIETVTLLAMLALASAVMGFGKDGKGVIIREAPTVALATLAADTALVMGKNVTLAEDFRMLKSKIRGTLKGVTTGELEAGLMLGIANGQLTAAQIKASLEANGPNDRSDRASIELAERYVQLIGEFRGVNNNDSEIGLMGDEGGPVVVIKPRWTFSDPESWQFFIWNNGAAPTTGASVVLQVVHYGVWVT